MESRNRCLSRPATDLPVCLLQQWHPDRHKGDDAAKRRFQEIQQAYEGRRGLPGSLVVQLLCYSSTTS